jgi:MFS family permease
LIGAGIWAIGFNVYFSFIIIYLEHHVGLSLTWASLVMFIALLTSMLLGIPIGMIVDRVGRKKMGLLAIIAESLFLIIFAFTVDLILIIIFGALWVIFMTMWRIAAQTWIKDLYPSENIAQYSGYFLLFNVLIGMSIGPLIGGYIAAVYGKSIIIDGIPGNVPPPMIFIVGAVIMLFALIPVIMAKEKKDLEK